MPGPPWINEAKKLIGIHEIPGTSDHPEILQLWKDSHLSGIKSESVPWCAAFVSACLERSGIKSTRSDAAKSYLGWGRKLDHPEVGAIAVKIRAGGYHVFFVLARDAGSNIVGIGGNQSDAVTIATFDRTSILGYFWPEGYALPDVAPLPPYTASVGISTKES